MKTFFPARTALLALALGVCGPLLGAEQLPVKKPEKAAIAGQQVGIVDINTADIPTLEAVPEIGTSFANAVVAARPFKSVDDLQRVLKLTPEKMAALRLKVTASPLDPPAPTPPEPPPKGVSKPSPVKEGKATPRQDVTERYERSRAEDAKAKK